MTLLSVPPVLVITVLPQQCVAPLASAHVVAPPAAITDMCRMTSAGSSREDTVVRPSSSLPQQRMVPEFFSPHVCSVPAVIAT